MAMFDTFIGLEIHIHLLTKSKVFCSCPSTYGAPPNTNVCPVCLGYPGVLPVVNREALKFSYMVGTALHCQLSKHTFFDRKNYFYPDMTKNYQITQFTEPLGIHGWMEFETGGSLKKIRIHDIHLEEDAGKMIHDGNRSLLDYNRAGTSLLEIVTEPDFSSGEEAEDFLQSFRRMVRYLGVCDGNMEEGSLRCDANISINKPGKGLGTKVEIKNLNSSRNVRRAMAYEFKRQSRVLKTGGKLIQETRLWDDANGKTQGMRTKETANDYRYFPEPDIPPFEPKADFFEDVTHAMVELPLMRKQRLFSEYQLPAELLDFLIEERERVDFFERAVLAGAQAELTAKWIKGEMARLLSAMSLDFSTLSLPAERFSSLMKLLGDGTIHANIAKQVLEIMVRNSNNPEALSEPEAALDPAALIESLGLGGSDNSEELEKLILEVLAANETAVAQIREGNQKAIGFLMGMVMKQAEGRPDPGLVRSLLLKHIEG